VYGWIIIHVKPHSVLQKKITNLKVSATFSNPGAVNPWTGRYLVFILDNVLVFVRMGLVNLAYHRMSLLDIDR